MNKTIAKIKKLVTNTLVLENIRINMSDLEDKGTLFYMNDQNGTEFDWHVNHRLPYLMAFYNDEANMGAIKVGVYDDCKVSMYFYGDSGKKLEKEVKAQLDCSERELLELAVLLKSFEDKGNFWNKSVESISSLHIVRQKQIDKFLENKALYFDLRED